MAKAATSKVLSAHAKIAVAGESCVVAKGRGVGGRALATSLKNSYAQAALFNKNNRLNINKDNRRIINKDNRRINIAVLYKDNRHVRPRPHPADSETNAATYSPLASRATPLTHALTEFTPFSQLLQQLTPAAYALPPATP